MNWTPDEHNMSDLLWLAYVRLADAEQHLRVHMSEVQGKAEEAIYGDKELDRDAGEGVFPEDADPEIDDVISELDDTTSMLRDVIEDRTDTWPTYYEVPLHIRERADTGMSQSEREARGLFHFEKWEPDSQWDDHPKFPAAEWQIAIINLNTRQSYVDWVNLQIELEAAAV